MLFRSFVAIEALIAIVAGSQFQSFPAPFGLQGGGDGQVGQQWVERADGRREDLAGTAHVRLAPGDAITIATPGGGGFGRAETAPEKDR